MPSDLVIEDRSQFGVYRPGTIITETDTGLRRSRAYGEHNLATYTLRFTPSGYSAETYEMLMALMHSTAVSVSPFWVKEPISKPRIGVPGELTDGSRTTFVNPLDTTSARALLDGEVDQASSGIANHAASNLLTDAQANGAGGVSTGLDAYGSCSLDVSTAPVLDGQYAFLISTVGAQSNVGINTNDTADRPAVTLSEEYTAQASFLPTDAAHTYRVEGQYRTSGGATTDPVFNSSSTGPVGKWLHLRASATAPADAATLEIRAYRTTSATDQFVVACLGVAPGDFGRWFLPSLSPRLMEWASAPATKKRLTFSGPSCKRWARVALNRDQQSVSVERLGDTTVARRVLREALFLP